jgi:hypothetical protein
MERKAGISTAYERIKNGPPPRDEAFIRRAYPGNPDDQREVKAAILKAITNPKRPAGCLSACCEMD